MIRALDYAPFPLIALGAPIAAWGLIVAGLPPIAITPLVIVAVGGLLAVLERVRPEREDFVALDDSWGMQLGHFLFDFELGTNLGGGLALLLGMAVKTLGVPLWPIGLPLAAQVALAMVLYEAGSYAQHRFLHSAGPRAWRFHTLHHSGSRLNLVRVFRFHVADVASTTFLSMVPLVLLQCPEDTLAVLLATLSALGMLQHANLRMRTPRWLDAVVCTPAIHRRHHSIRREESDANYGTSVMVYDHVFGTYAAANPVGPERIGIDGDSLPKGFWARWIYPFG